MTRYPLLPIAAAFAAGIGAAPHFYLTASEQITLLTLVSLVAALLLTARRSWPGLILCWLGFFLCGTFFAAAEHIYLPSNHLERLAAAGRLSVTEPCEITGWVRSPTERRPGNENFDLEAEEVRQADHVYATTGGVRVYYFPSKDHPATLDVAYGSRLTVSLDTLGPPRNFLTTDSFDWEAYMRRQDISFTGRVRGSEDTKVLPGHSSSRWQAAIAGLRGQFLEHLDRLYPGPHVISDRGAILRAMLLGDDDWLSPNVQTAFQASGTYHVLVVSGWNLFALAIPLLWLMGRLRLPEWLGSSLVMLAVVGFAALAEGGASVSRAAVMFVIYLLTRFFYRERAALNSIAVAALVLLVVHPSDLWNAGFQLSFFAVLVLAAVAVPLVNWVAAPCRIALRRLDDHSQDRLLEPRQLQFRNDLRTLLDYFPGKSAEAHPQRRRVRITLAACAYALLWLAEGLLFTALIQIGLFPATVEYFHRLTWSGIVANLVVLPMASATVVAGLPLLFLSLVWWRAAQWGAIALGWATGALQWIVEHSASWVLINRRVPAPPVGLVIAFFLLPGMLAVLIARRSRWTWPTLASVAVVCVMVSRAPYAPRSSPGQLEVNVLDVGQGDSIFVSFPNGSTMLVDGGGTIPIPGAPPPRMDIGESVISSYLWSRRIQRIDYVVLTHDHWDHMGGLEAVLTNFQVGELWLGVDPGDRSMDWLRRIASSRGTRNVQVAEGMRKNIDGIGVEALSPPPDWSPKRVSNNDSIVLRLEDRERHILLPGDVEARMERRLLTDGEPLASDVLKIAHHGSRTSSTPAFLEQVAARFGIISVGAYKRFGHPNDETLEALHRAGMRIYRTDLDGTTTISTNGHRIAISTYRDSLAKWPPFNAVGP